MQLSTHRPDDLGQPPLNRRVNVFVVRLEFKPSTLKFRQYLPQPTDDRLRLSRSQHTRRRARPRISDAAANILLVHPLVKADAVIQRLEIIVARFAESPPTPQRHAFAPKRNDQ